MLGITLNPKTALMYVIRKGWMDYALESYIVLEVSGLRSWGKSPVEVMH